MLSLYAMFQVDDKAEVSSLPAVFHFPSPAYFLISFALLPLHVSRSTQQTFVEHAYVRYIAK